MPKTKKTDAQRLSAFSFPYPTHVACILLVAPTGARADDGSSLVHWETWCSLLALLPYGVVAILFFFTLSVPIVVACTNLLASPCTTAFSGALPIHRARQLCRFRHIGLPQLEIPTMLRSECQTRSGACLFRYTARPQCPNKGYCASRLCVNIT